MLRNLLAALSFWLNQICPSLAVFSRQLQHNRTWASRYLLLLSKLCNYESVIARLAKRDGGQIISMTNTVRMKDHHVGLTFEEMLISVRPTVLIRVETHSGYSVIVRALLDTGAWKSAIDPRLAALLLTEGASQIFKTPRRVLAFPGTPNTIDYTAIGPLRLRSLDDSRVIENVQMAVISTTFDQLPLDSIAHKMASFGIPMFSTVIGYEVLYNDDSDWESSPYYVDMIIGQDLLNRHFYSSPTQTNFAINLPYNYKMSSRLILQPTPFGLTFLGTFFRWSFDHWADNLDENEIQALKDAIDSATQMPPKICSAEFADEMTYQMKKPFWRLLYGFIPSTVILVHAVFAFVLLLPSLVVVQFTSKVISKLLYFPVILSNCLTFLYEHFLLHLIRAFMFFSKLYQKAVQPFASILRTGQTTCTYSPDQIDFQYMSFLGCIAVNPETKQSQQIRVHIDTGSVRSFIFPNLIRSLGLTPSWSREPLSDGCYMYGGCVVAKVNLVQLTQPGDPTPPNSITVNLLIRDHDDEELTVKNISKSSAKLHQATLEHHQVSLSDVNSDLPLGIIIGTDLLAAVMQPLPVQRNIQLLPNLSAVETTLGYVLQGTQEPENSECNSFDGLYVPPWSYYLDKYLWAAVLIAVDLLFLYSISG